MTIDELNGKNICILGYGREGQATLNVLARLAPNARITIADRQPIPGLNTKYALISGEQYLDDLTDFDVIIKSPGIAWEPPGFIRTKITSATQLFLECLPAGTLTIGITGTKGKSSTANLIFHILKEAGKEAYLAGNIGEPMLSLLPTAKAKQIYILELSSYQLQNLTSSPQVAVVTSFFPDHVDYHGSLANYFEAKTHIARYQHPTDTIFYNADYEACREIAELSAGSHIKFNGNDLPDLVKAAMPQGIPASNVAAAYLVARHLDIDDAHIIVALKTVHNLQHRQEPLGFHQGIEWMDDSAATTPQSTILAIDAQAGRVGALILGGLNRDYNFESLAAAITKAKIRVLILFPETGELVRACIEEASPSHQIRMFEASSMDEAVRLAAAHTHTGKLCLLSSGAPSYNLYKNFNERGDAFKKAVAALG